MTDRKCSNCARSSDCLYFKRHKDETTAINCSDFQFSESAPESGWHFTHRLGSDVLTNFDVESEFHIWECEGDYGHVTDNEQDELVARFLRTFGGLYDENKSRRQ